MKATWRAWADRYAALSRREQVMVALAVLAVAGFLLFNFWVEPALRRGTDQRARLATLHGEVVTLEQQSAALKTQLQDPDAANRKVLADLQTRLAGIETRIVALDDKLVPPQRMGQVLQAVLGRHRGLSLVSLRSLPPEPLVTLPGDGKAGEGRPVPPRQDNIYRHGLEIRLTGRYADLLGYVGELEKLPQRLLWGGMALTVTAYPNSELTLTVFTLSRERDWLAV